MKDFTLIRKTIEVDRIGQKFLLTPFGDVHQFAPNHHVEKWKEWKKEKKENHTKDHYYLGMGDYMDFLSASERMMYHNAAFHESTRGTLDDFVKGMNKEFIDDLSFMKGNLIGCIEGNHHYKYQSGWTTTMQMCEKLDAPYLGSSAIIKLAFRYKGHSASILIFANHGLGSGRLPGSTFNKVEQMREVFPECDIFCQNHDHRRGAIPVTAMFVKDSGKTLRIHHKKQWLCRGGSFLAAYIPNSQSYIAKKSGAPMDLGTVTFEIEFKTKRFEGLSYYMDIHAYI